MPILTRTNPYIEYQFLFLSEGRKLLPREEVAFYLYVCRAERKEKKKKKKKSIFYKAVDDQQLPDWILYIPPNCWRSTRNLSIVVCFGEGGGEPVGPEMETNRLFSPSANAVERIGSDGFLAGKSGWFFKKITWWRIELLMMRDRFSCPCFDWVRWWEQASSSQTGVAAFSL